MSIKQAIQDAIKEAMKNKDHDRLECLRMAKGALLLKEKEGPKGELEEADAVAALRGEIKKRHNSIETFRSVGQEEVARKTEVEIAIFEEFLPKQLGAGQVEERVRAFLEDLRASVPAGLEAPCLDFSGARFLAGQSLERLRNDQPRNLARGVVVAPYEAIRGLPFRALVLMGLGEGVFPEPDTRNPMDLRAQRRRPGDVTSSEQQRYLFLEALLSARDHLVLTFVGLDDLTGERREPSSLFKGLRALAGRYLQERFAPSGNHDPLRIEHPLRRFDPAYFPQWFPEVESPLRTCSVPAIEEARALRLGRDLRAAGPLELPPFLDDLPAPPALRTLLQEALDHPGTGRTELPNIVRISLTDLTRWLECPLTGAAAVRLGLRSEDLEDRDRIEEEAFQTAFLESHRLQQEVAFACASEDTDPETTFFRQLAPLQRQGRAPHGLFAEAEWKACGPRIEAWVGTLRSQPHPIRRLRLGSARSRRAAADETL
ncbi:MAG TPA: exodeoxyribonuclease V subunit gamma, partial [Holophaga sp.]|nr:exodeoxyribonuclease V subunit gamma [Holophaga sp.]